MRIALGVSYSGQSYQGWQSQASGRTVQDRLEAALGQFEYEPMLEAASLLALSIAAMTGMVAEATFRTERMRGAAELGYATATDLADWLVRQANIPFREAHHITGSAVKLAESRGVALDQLALADLKAIDSRVDERVFAALSVEASVAARASQIGRASCRERVSSPV